MTDRCNFRCTYCMPADIFGHAYEFIPRDEILSFEEIERITKIFVQLGVTKIRLTGGEPLLRKELEVLIKKLSQIVSITDLALTTNGYFLEEKVNDLKDAGLKRISVSIDSLNPELFKKISGRKLEFKKVLKGVKAAAHLGFHPIKINAVVQKGVNDHEILALAKFAKREGYIMRFIEYMDVGNLNAWKMDHVVPANEIVRIISAEMPIEPIERHHKGEVANRYRYLDGDGEFGIIASVTQPFCGNCTRARLSAEGKIYTCLFSGIGHDLKEPLRTGASDEELLRMIAKIWNYRMDRYSEERTSQTEMLTQKKVEMYQIGG